MAILKEQLRTDLTAATKARDELTKSTLRMALAAVMKAEVAGSEQVELTDDEILTVLQAETKRRADAATMYTDGGRPELAEKEQAEAAVLARYLPAALTDAELDAIIAEEVAAAQAAGNTGMKAMGGVVKVVRERAGAGADGGRIAAAVKAALAG